jgi:hypothetical protein
LNGAAPGSVERRLYFSAKVLTQASQNTWLFALFLVAGTGGRPAIDLSSLFAALVLPTIFLSIPGGAVADRLGPARGFVIGSVLRLLPVAIAIFVLNDGWIAWVFAFAASAATMVFDPADLALARVVRGREPARLQAALIAMQYVGQGLGMLALGPGMYYLAGTTGVLAATLVLMTALSGIGAILAWRLRGRAGDAPASVAAAMNLRAVGRYFASDVRARCSVTTLGMKMIVSRGVLVALPLYLRHDINGGPGLLAFILGPGIVGLIVGLWWCSRTVTVARSHEVMRWSLIGMTVALGTLAVLDYGVAAAAQHSGVRPVIAAEGWMNTTFAVAIPASFLLGLCLAGSHVAPRLAISETAPLGLQGRVFAAQITFTELALFLPLCMAGVFTTYAGPRAMLGVLGGATAAAAIIGEADRWRSRPLESPALEPVSNLAAGDA